MIGSGHTSETGGGDTGELSHRELYRFLEGQGSALVA
jgi:hypothetical protein